MHPGGTNIIESNAGLDSGLYFGLLTDTNNPEIPGLLNKYFMSHLIPTPDFRQSQEISMLCRFWAGITIV